MSDGFQLSLAAKFYQLFNTHLVFLSGLGTTIRSDSLQVKFIFVICCY